MADTEIEMIYIVEDGELVQYERKGKCTRCGECCCKPKLIYRLLIALRWLFIEFARLRLIRSYRRAGR